MIKRFEWNDCVFKELNTLIKNYRMEKFKDKFEKNYVVSDWDNTAIFFDVEEAVFMYQLLNLKYKMNVEEFSYAIGKDLNIPIGEIELANRVIREIKEDYTKLLKLRENYTLDEIKEFEVYNFFVSKMLYLYTYISSFLTYKLRCYRILYLFYKMDEEEVRKLAREAIDYFKDRKVLKKEFSSKLKNGMEIKSTRKLGVRVSQEQINLFSEFRNNNIDVYICSASFQIIVEEFATGNYGYGFSKGDVIGLHLVKDKDGTFLPEVDEEKLITMEEGKAEYLNRLEELYKKPPILYMGDADGDYYALTYKGLKVGIIINRTRGNLILELKEKAKKKDYTGTVYLLQGRDEQKYKFINSTESIEI